MTEWVYLNGGYVPRDEAVVSIFDHGFLYGDGVFDSARAYDGSVFELDAHIDRIYDSAAAIALKIPLTKKEMHDVTLETLRRNELRDAYVRHIVSRGPGPFGLNPESCPKPTVAVIATEWGAMYGDKYENGLRAVTVAVRRNPPDTLSPNIKSLNYLNNILAKIEANAKGGDEALMFDTNGRLSEGSGDNVFIVKNGELLTPPTLNNLRGITRAVVLKLAEELRLPCRECELSFFDLYTADEVFVTGTAAEVAPITVIDGREVGQGNPGPITLKLIAEFREYVKSHGTPIYD